MATILDLQDRGLRYGVIVDAAATTATLAAIERAGLRYKVEVASGITAADRAALDRRGLQYFVPVAATVSMADRAILERQGLRYAVQVDPTVLTTDLAALERQGLSYFVEVDSSGTAIATAAGGAILLVDETNGFAVDFTHPVDGERVAVKTAGTVVSSGLSFFTNAGVSSKWVYNSSGILTSVAAGSLAVDYDPTTLVAKGLLCEPAATNEQFPSSDFDHANWPKTSCTVTANAVAAPNGATEGDAIIPTAGLNNAYVNRAALVTNGANTTFSLFIKNGTLGSNWIRVAIVATPTYSTWFNLAAGTAGTSAGSPVSYNITTLPGGWYRLTTTFLPGAASATVYLAPETGDGSSAGITGDGVKPAFYLWGAQMEVGTVATSPIPTTSVSAVTRAADNITATTAAMGAGWSAAGANSFVINTAGNLVSNAIYWGMHDTTDNERYMLDTSTGTKKARLFTADGNVTQTDLGGVSTPVAGTYYKIAAAMMTNDFAMSIDGAAVATDVVATLPTVTRLQLGGSRTSTGRNIYIKTYKSVPRRMTNGQLQTEATP